MKLRMDLKRLTMLSLAAIFAGLVGCSAFKEKVVPTLNAEVTPGSSMAAPAAAKYFVEVRPDKAQPLAVEKELTDQIHVQTALDQSGALRKFHRAHIKLYRPLAAGGWHKMNLEFDRENHRIPSEYDYALLPGDRVIVIEDTTTVLDDLLGRALQPLGITPPKKRNPAAEKYEIRG
jgi:hypothetical protein